MKSLFYCAEGADKYALSAEMASGRSFLYEEQTPHEVRIICWGSSGHHRSPEFAASLPPRGEYGFQQRYQLGTRFNSQIHAVCVATKARKLHPTVCADTQAGACVVKRSKDSSLGDLSTVKAFSPAPKPQHTTF